MLIETMTTLEFEKGLKKTKTAVIPIGSIEEHGPHLPMNTDIFHAYEIAKLASEIVPVFVSPPIQFGVCRSTASFPGTIGIHPKTLISLIDDVASSLYRHGIKNFILYSGHAGMNHVAAMIDAADLLMGRFEDIKFMVITDLELTDKDFFDLVETPSDSHAGEIETSLIMSLAPDLVGKIPDADYPKFPKPLLVRDTRDFWQTGVWGDPKKASTEKGGKMLKILAKNLAGLVKKISK